MRYKEFLKILKKLTIKDDEKFLVELLEDDLKSSIKWNNYVIAFCVGAVTIGILFIAYYSGKV